MPSAHRRKLPIGTQTFSDIREGGYYYVDKTLFIEKLANQNKYYFLSRSRRFGKSLLLDTLGCLFEGRKALSLNAGFPVLGPGYVSTYTKETRY